MSSVSDQPFRPSLEAAPAEPQDISSSPIAPITPRGAIPSAIHHSDLNTIDAQAGMESAYPENNATEGSLKIEQTEPSGELRLTRMCSDPQPPSRPLDRRLSNMPRRLCTTLTEWWDALVYRWWLWEITCLVLSCVFMMAAVVMLLCVDEMSLADWAFPIQPNSMASVFMTISKSTLLASIAECIGQAKWMQFGETPRRLGTLQQFDTASRGPWGSLQLLLHPRAAGWVAAAGAILTIATLALDPFTQQIIAFPSRMVASSNGSAHFAATQSFDYNDSVAMHGSILNGIYVSNIPPGTFDCTTAQCKWNKPVTSLGVCSECRNISSIVEVACQTEPGPLQPNEENHWSFSTNSCTYTVNANITFNIYMQTLTLPAANGRHAEYASQYTKAKLASAAIEHGLGDLIIPKTRWIQTVLSYATFFDESRRDMPPISLEHLEPHIFACGVYWCGQVYDNPAVVDGTLKSVNPSARYSLDAEIGPDGNFSYIQTDDGRSDILVVPESSKAEFPGNTTFTISSNAHLRLTRFLDNLFNVSESTGNDEFSVFPEEDSGLDGFTDAVYRNENVSDTFFRIAKSMSEQVRTYEGGQLVPGLALDNETYVKVRWEWMALPLAVLTSAVCLLVVTILTNTRRQTAVWKSSIIAVLFLKIKGLNERDIRLDTVKEMADLADRIDVVLEKT